MSKSKQQQIIPFNNLKFQIYGLPESTNLLEAFPKLNDYPEFTVKIKDRDLVIRYIIFCYDPGSDLVRDIHDLAKRKEKALDLAGFKKRNGEWSLAVQDILYLKNPEVKSMVLAYLRNVNVKNSRLYRMIVVNEEAFDEYSSLVVGRVDDKVSDENSDKDVLTAANIKGKLMEEMDKINKRLNGYYEEFLGDNSDLIEQEEEIFTPITPETAHLLKKS